MHAKDLMERLRPHVDGTAQNRCMSEIDDLLSDIYDFLRKETRELPAKAFDPTIATQMNLDLPENPEPKRGDIKYYLNR